MGLFDRMKKRRMPEYKGNSEGNFEEKYDFSVGYNSEPNKGIMANGKFSDLEKVTLEDGTEKLLQKLYIMYQNPDGSFDGKDYYMDPILEENGENKTKEFYMQMLKQNKSLLKGFILPSQVLNMPTNYIGKISYNKEKIPFREIDRHFEKLYKDQIERNKVRREEYDNNKTEKGLREKLAGMTSSEWDKNPAQDLTNVECPYPESRNNQNGERYR